ncbi:MAG TPA: hypothetical protein DFS52_26055 [Myxococcales bacterium]|jgi:DNA/RNA-binding domain of Phe-tRNA-synthetase-like protein|nr:hypothetical protein [Myxococcales bacterium]
MLTLEIAPHPLLHLRAFTTELPAPLGELAPPDWLASLLALDAESPLAPPDDAIRSTVRDLLRHGGFKPTGRSKPASEYLLRTATEGPLGSINLAVDACNAVSLHSGLPMSVVDLDRTRLPLRVGIAQAGDAYVFNTSGQVIDLEGLLCLFDAEGPCANAVKDAQRTKTSASTCRTLSIVWGPRALAERVDAATAWYRQLLERVPATTAPVA